MNPPVDRSRSGRRYDFSGGFPPPSRPRPVKKGIVARSSRGKIGERWWSQRFIEVLESFALGSRLSRGKNYARAGQVLDLRVEPGEVSAHVQGSRRKPYTVSIGLESYPELIWAKVEIALAEQAILSAQLLAGEMPAELEEVFDIAGTPLFPSTIADLDLECSCPDWEVPCKHLAATFYLLAERFDDDPFQILHWRGRERGKLLSRLRELRGNYEAAPSVQVATQPVVAPLGARAVLADLVTESFVPDDLDQFWEFEPLPVLPTHPELPPDLLLRQLPIPAPSLGGADLVDYLSRCYEALSLDPG